MLAPMPLIASRSTQSPYCASPVNAEEVLDHLEAGPGAALGLEGVGGRRQLGQQLVARQELFVRPVAAGGEDLVGLEVVVGVLEDRPGSGGSPLTRYAGPGTAQRVHVAIGVVGVGCRPLGRREDVGLPGVHVPVLRVLPDVGEVAVLHVAGGQVGAIEVLAQRVPFGAVALGTRAACVSRFLMAQSVMRLRWPSASRLPQYR